MLFWGLLLPFLKKTRYTPQMVQVAMERDFSTLVHDIRCRAVDNPACIFPEASLNKFAIKAFDVLLGDRIT